MSALQKFSLFCVFAVLQKIVNCLRSKDVLLIFLLCGAYHILFHTEGAR